jgi:hypothetical protein
MIATRLPIVILAFCVGSQLCFGNNNREGPTQSIAESKELRVFVSELAVTPKEFDLGDTVYRVREAWIEHPFFIRPSWFHTSRHVEDTLTLCLVVSPVRRHELLARASICVKNGRLEVMTRGGWLLFQRLNSEIPAQIALRCDTRDKEVVLSLSQKPSQLPEPTSGLRPAAAHL